MEDKGEGSFRPIIIVMLISLVIAGFWDKSPIIKKSIHAVLDPSLGWLLNWHLVGGMFVIVFLIGYLQMVSLTVSLLSRSLSCY